MAPSRTPGTSPPSATPPANEPPTPGRTSSSSSGRSASPTSDRAWPGWSGADDRRVGVAGGLAQGDVEVEDHRGVDDEVDVALGIEVEVGAVDGEPDVGDLGVGVRDDQGVLAARGLEEVAARGVDLGVLLVLPGAGLREGE